jgi:signal transduction histidine kinase
MSLPGFIRRDVRSETLVDWAPAVLLILVDLADDIARAFQYSEPHWLWVTVPATFVMMGSLGFRRRWPLTVLATVLASMAMQSAPLPGGQDSSFQAFIALCLAAFGAGMYTSGRRELAVAMLLPGLLMVAFAVTQGGAFAFDAIPNWFWPAGCAAVGRTLSDRKRLVRMLEDRAERLEREREDKARAAVAEERARIAREMHDVVAHNVSVMVVQAGAARRVLESDPVPAKEALLTIEKTGRQTLQEMRRLLGVLRTSEDGLALAPQPGLGEVGSLIDKLRQAGIPVELREEGDARQLPAGHDLVAYRVVQEGLTNVLKHAGNASVRVTVRFRGDTLELEVVDDGKGPPPDADRSGGHGLFGMRERLALYGGTLQTGPSENGGFALRAMLPLESTP